MKHLFLAPLLTALLIVNITFAQVNPQTRTDTLKISIPNITTSGNQLFKGTLRSTYKVPLIFVAGGIFSLTDNEILSKEEIYEERNEWVPKFHHNADNYLQHAPILAVYGLNLIGVKGKNDFGNRTALLIKSELIMAALTCSLKRITTVPRPDDPGAKTSFPSGHTAQAFATATFLSKEYGHKSIWYSIAAYSMATTVGAMRVMNNRHWVSDVLVGAGIGIFSTNLVYLTHQNKWGRNKREGQTIVMPSFDGQTGMLSLVHRFN